MSKKLPCRLSTILSFCLGTQIQLGYSQSMQQLGNPAAAIMAEPNIVAVCKGKAPGAHCSFNENNVEMKGKCQKNPFTMFIVIKQGDLVCHGLPQSRYDQCKGKLKGDPCEFIEQDIAVQTKKNTLVEGRCHYMFPQEEDSLFCEETTASFTKKLPHQPSPGNSSPSDDTGGGSWTNEPQYNQNQSPPSSNSGEGGWTKEPRYNQ